MMNINDIDLGARICDKCGAIVYYFDSPPAKYCGCGGLFSELSEEKYEELKLDWINRNCSFDHATVSC